MTKDDLRGRTLREMGAGHALDQHHARRFILDSLTTGRP